MSQIAIIKEKEKQGENLSRHFRLVTGLKGEERANSKAAGLLKE